MPDRAGFLLVTMEPPPALEEEFNDWYDHEHVPERQAVDGFLTAQRFVSVSGWPRYLAYYDLRDPAVIGEPGYRAISGDHFSPWSKRILAKVRGVWRAYGEQRFPGRALMGRAAGLLLIRFSGLDPASEPELLQRTRAVFDAMPGVLQFRVVRDRAAPAPCYGVLVEISSPTAVASFDVEAFGGLARHIDLCTRYQPYWDRAGLTPPAP